MNQNRNSEKGSILIFIVVSLVIVLVVISIGGYISTQMQITGDRRDLEVAYQYASGGASIVAHDLEKIFREAPNDLENKIVASGFVHDTKRKANDDFKDHGKPSDEKTLRSLTYSSMYGADGTAAWSEALYTKTIPADVMGQEVTAELWLPTDGSQEARVVTYSTVNGVKEEVTMNLSMSYGFGAAIISTHQGSADTGASKKSGQKGNVAIFSKNANATYVDGGILSNGTTSYNSEFSADPSTISSGLYSTEDELPNYTKAGSPDQLFDFDRFTAVADSMGTNYANTGDFKAAVAADSDGVLEGVIVVNIEDGADDWEASDFPSGINVNGTLIMKFDPNSWKETDKLKVLCTVNVNPADLTNLDTSDPTTFTSGYPAKLTDPKFAAHNHDISSAGFQNFKKSDDLPAIMYNTAIADFHGNMNVSGVIYSPVFAEIENKVDGQIQYIKGSVIVGGGIWYENKKNALSIISYDPNALDRLATKGSNGKVITVVRRD